MKADHTPKSISPSIVYTLSSKYPHEIPKDLQTLEELRVHTIPETLAQRRTDGDAFLEKAEVINLVDWKLCVPSILNCKPPILPLDTPIDIPLLPVASTVPTVPPLPNRSQAIASPSSAQLPQVPIAPLRLRPNAPRKRSTLSLLSPASALQPRLSFSLSMTPYAFPFSAMSFSDGCTGRM